MEGVSPFFFQVITTTGFIRIYIYSRNRVGWASTKVVVKIYSPPPLSLSLSLSLTLSLLFFFFLRKEIRKEREKRQWTPTVGLATES